MHSRGRCLERTDRVLLFAADPQRRAAGDDDTCPGRAAEDRRDVGRGSHQVLEVVQDQQGGAIRQVREERIGSGSLRTVEEAHGPSDRRPNECRLLDLVERDEPRAVRRGGRTRPSELDGQSGLADAAGPGERQQAVAIQELEQLADLALPADEARQRHRDVA